MATDMKTHFSIIASFEEKMEKLQDLNIERTDEMTQEITSMLTHLMDLNGGVKKYPIAFKWSKKVNEEFTNQVNDEENLKIAITPYCTKLHRSEVYYKNESNYMSIIV